MTNWEPVAILPNIKRANLDGGAIAITSIDDDWVHVICQCKPVFAELLSRFTDAFGVAIDPSILIVAGSLTKLPPEAFMSFRDLAVVCIVPYCRALNAVHKNSGRIVYSDSFWLYPWNIANDNRYITASTPAFGGIHEVVSFRGQSSPELPVMDVQEIDGPLFRALVAEWVKYYQVGDRTWRRRALFRSMNMAVEAASLPAGVGTTIFDLGRSVSLWVSALEILSHPRRGRANLVTVARLLDDVTYVERGLQVRRYAPYAGTSYKPRRAAGKKKSQRVALPLWFYGKLLEARNNFLHGNPVTPKSLKPTRSNDSLFWLAPLLYRLALTGFLGKKMRAQEGLPYWLSDDAASLRVRGLYEVRDRQHMIERGLKRIRNVQP